MLYRPLAVVQKRGLMRRALLNRNGYSQDGFCFGIAEPVIYEMDHAIFVSTCVGTFLPRSLVRPKARRLVNFRSSIPELKQGSYVAAYWLTLPVEQIDRQRWCVKQIVRLTVHCRQVEFHSACGGKRKFERSARKDRSS